jgi:hypothetical protein
MSIGTISEWWDTLSGWQQLYWGIALFFSVLFVIQYIGALFGAGEGMDQDAGIPGDHDGSIDPGFTWLSLRSVIAFFTFFGWSGVFLLAKGTSLWGTLIGSFFSGMLAMALVGYLLYLFARQTQSGNYYVEQSLYQHGEVYLTIPGAKSGTGKIHVRIGNATREVDAITEGKTLPNGAHVLVTGILDDHVVLVEESTS